MTFSPWQKDVRPLMLTVGIVGLGFTVTVTLFDEFAEQPEEFETVREYSPDALAVNEFLSDPTAPTFCFH